MLLRLSNRIRHDGPARAERLVAADRRVTRGLMLNLGIELRAEQNHDRGNPHPHHHADAGAERAIRRVVMSKACEIPRQQRRAYQPRCCGENAAQTDPLPARLPPARPVAVEQGKADDDDGQQQRPPRQTKHSSVVS